MNRSHNQGFTIVELMLSMSFIGVMLITIALCTIQISTIYSRGETVRQLNQAVRVVTTDIEGTIGSMYPFEVDQSAINSGRLCMGRYSYIWSTPSTTNSYINAADGMIRFVRVSDPSGSLCDNLSARVDKSDAVELIESGDRTLIVHSFAITPVVADTTAGQRLYTITMLIGTDNTGAIDTTSNTCRPPSDSQADLTYCAINEFTITTGLFN